VGPMNTPEDARAAALHEAYQLIRTVAARARAAAPPAGTPPASTDGAPAATPPRS